MTEESIGIDLGTTYCCVATFRNGKVEIIPNDQGNRTTPSFIAFTETERLIGDGAKYQAPRNPNNTIFDVKRMIGRKFSDPIVQNDLKYYTFKVISDATDKPTIKVMYQGEEKSFYSEQLSGMLLGKLKEYAESYLGHKVSKAVITCPAYFNDSQRQATKDAGAIAGLDVLRVINEPTAASIAYGMDKKKDGKILIFDYGGGTLDVSILELDEGTFQVLSTSGDTHLGGEDLDNKLMIHCIKEFAKKNNLNLDKVNEIIKNLKLSRRLKSKCEESKKILSSTQHNVITLDAFYNGIDLNVSITRAKFEELAYSDFTKCLVPVDKALSDAKLDKHSIDDVVLIGGSTRIPKIKQMLKEYFGKEPKIDINPDEAVAYGAAIQASIILGVNDPEINSMVLIDVNPLSLGVEVRGCEMSSIIPRNSIIPTEKKEVYTTGSDNQTMVSIRVFEGERTFTKDCNSLGKFDLTGIPPAPRGTPQIEVSFSIDRNGILKVSAIEKVSGKTNNIVIKNEKGRLSDEQIRKMTEDAKKYEEEDKKKKEQLDARNDFENYLYSLKNTISDEVKSKIGEENIKKIMELVNDGTNWIETNGSTATIEEIKEKQKSIEKQVTPIFYKQNSGIPETPNVETPNVGKPNIKKPKIEEVD